MKTPKNTINLLVKLFFLISIFSLSAGLYYLYTNQQDISNQLRALQGKTEVTSSITEEKYIGQTTAEQSCGESCKDEIEKAVSEAIAAIPRTTEKVVEKQTVVTQRQSGTTYVPLGTTGSTTSTDWEDIADSAVYIDLENDYGADTKVSWEASLKVAHGNGKVFARLYDDTNKIAVDFSELSTENNATFQQVVSPDLPFWKGRNLYKVQIKSLNSFEVTYSGGRIRISY